MVLTPYLERVRYHGDGDGDGVGYAALTHKLGLGRDEAKAIVDAALAEPGK